MPPGQSRPKERKGRHVSHRPTWDGEAQPLTWEDSTADLGVQKSPSNSQGPQANNQLFLLGSNYLGLFADTEIKTN